MEKSKKQLIKGGKPTKEEFLKLTDKGVALLLIIFGNKIRRSNGKFKNVRSPLYKDSKPGLSFYFSERGRLMFRDHGNPDHSGDVFDFLALYFGLDIKSDFPYLIEKAWELFLTKKALLPKYNVEEFETANSRKAVKITLDEVEFTSKTLGFWNDLGIDQQLLKLNNVIPIKGYKIRYDDGSTENKQLNHSRGSFTFAYKHSNLFYKIYRLNPKGFFSIGNKPKNFYYGEQLCESGLNMRSPIFIVGGEKDNLSIQSLGHPCINLYSETS